MQIAHKETRAGTERTTGRRIAITEMEISATEAAKKVLGHKKVQGRVHVPENFHLTK